MGQFDGLYDDILNGGTRGGAIPDNAARSFTGEALAGVRAGVAVELPKMIGQAMKAISDPGGGFHDAGNNLVEGAEERYNEDPATYAKSAYGNDKSDYNPLKYTYDAASMLPPSLAGAAAAIPVAAAGAPAAAVMGAGMIASGGLFGASQYQDTYERGIEAGLSEEDAKSAALKTASIEGGGEAIASAIPLKFLAKPFTKIAGKMVGQAAERGIVSSILGVKPFVKELGKQTLKELPVEMGTEFYQGAHQAQVEKDAGIRPDADWYQEGLQGAMAASMMTAGHMAGAGAGGAIKHRMTMNALTNPETNPDARLRALEEIGQRIDDVDPDKGKFWRLNGVNAIRNGQSIPLDDSFLSDLTQRAIPVEDVNLLEWNRGNNYPAVGGVAGPPAGPAGPGTGFTMRDPGYIDAEFDEVGPQGQVPGEQRMAIPFLPNEQAGLNDWFGQRPNGPQNLNSEDQSKLDDMVRARYGLTPGLEAAHDAASSPLNDHADPTESQIQAGNYRKGHVNIQGLDISIENPAGSVRSGKDADGKAWSTDIQHHYGYIKGTVGKDKDHIDTFIGNKPESDRVFVVDQIDPKTGKFDEAKVMIGFDSIEEALDGYLKNYDESGPSRVGAVTPVNMAEFKGWLKNGNTKKTFAGSDIGKQVHAKASSNSPSQETLSDGVPGNAEPSTNGGVGPATISSQHNAFVNGPSGSAPSVPGNMLPLGSNLKVVGGVVQSIPVDVMDDLSIGKRSAKNSLHDKPMLESLPSDTINNGANEPISGVVPGEKPDVTTSAGPTHDDTSKKKDEPKVSERNQEVNTVQPTKLNKGDTNDVTTEELTESGIKYDVNSAGEIIVMKDGKNTAQRDKNTGKWRVYEGSLKKEDLVVDDVSMREAMDELIGMREDDNHDKSRTLDETGRATDGKPIMPGDAFTTSSGRKTTAYPKQKGEKYASQWLIDNAVAESESRGDDWNAKIFGNVKPLKSGELTPADRDSMLMYLFGEQPPVVKKALKPLAPKPAEAPKEPELTLEDAKKSKYWPESLKRAREAAVTLGKVKAVTIAPETKADKMKPKGDVWTPEEFTALMEAKAADAKLKPYTVMEPQGMSTEEYEIWAENHALDTVKDRLAHEKAKIEKQDTRLGTLDKINTPELAMEFAQKLADVVERGESLDKIKVLQMVAELYGTTVKEIREKLEAQEADWRHVEEAMEYAVVKYAKAIVAGKGTVDQKLTRLQALYDAQPNLAKRDTTTKAGQQFSTPAPLAFLMGEAIGLTKQDAVYEPTAGNGMLVMGASPSKTIVNEYDAVRRANLSDQGFNKVYGNDILDPSIPAGVSDKSQDVVVANPPFGKADMEMVFDDMPLDKKEHIIVADALEKMRDNGRAAFIIGGHNFKKGTMGEADWNFLNWLYKHYNVRHNIDINGDVYRRMGTTYPIRMIVIDGRKATPDENYSVQDKEVNADKEALAMSEANSFEDVKKILEEKGYVDRRGQVPSGNGNSGLAEEAEEGQDQPNGASDRVPVGTGHDTDKRDSGTGKNSGRDSDGASTGRTGKDKRGSGKSPGSSRESVDGGSKSRSVTELTGDIKQDINNALSHVDAAIKAALKGITDPNKLSMGVTIDEKAYAEIKKHLAATLEELKKAFKDFNELISKFAETVMERYGEAIIPYATKFYGEVHAEHLANESKANEPTVKDEPMEGGNSLQAPYRPRSKGKSSDKLIPRNMEAFIKAALDDLEARHGDIDEYVASKLQYGSKKDLHKALFADQIDTVAMAIDNIDRGLGFINGSQTGAGKGRTVAAIMWYAKTKGLKSIFFTQQPKLFSDMYRDLKGIGHPEMKPYIIHGLSEAHIYDEDNNIIHRAFPPGVTSRSAEYERVASNVEKELADYDTVFIPYSQVNTANTQRDLLRALAPNSIVILDESHKAAGDGSNTGLFVQELLSLSPGVMYSSATFAKRPSSMPVYFRTNLGQTGMSMEELIASVEAGGVPLQQIISAQLARSGQYIRFEMDVNQIESNTMTFSEDTKAKDTIASDGITSVMRDLVDFSNEFSGWVETIKAQANIGKTKGNRVNVTTSSFSSVAHNTVAQLLLGLKVEMVAAKAVETLKADKKALINLSNTMSSFIEDIAAMEGVKSGEELDISFVDALRRTLRNQLTYTVKQPGQRRGEKVRIDPNELTDHLRAKYNRIMRKIDVTDVNIPASPIDMLRYRIEQAGYNVAEITGRNSRLDYSGDGAPVYRPMSKKDKNRNEIVNGFNKGTIDCVIFNAAGATGLSLHASQDFADRRIRKMLIAQADLNIDTVLQAMGRIFRTGQVEKPEYEFTLSALPGEKRPAAILQKKLASMNANTSADAKSAYTNEEVPDILNIYGDKVAAEYLIDTPDVNSMLGGLVSRNDAGEVHVPEDLMRKMTGKMALLPVALQEKIYKEIIEIYNAEIDYLNKTGQNRLIASVHDYQAKTLDKSVIYDGDENSPNPFTRPAYLEKVLTKVTKKPHTIEEVKEMAEKELAGRSQREYIKETSKDMMDRTKEYLDALNRDLEEARTNNGPTAAIERKISTIRENVSTYEELCSNFVVGDPYTVITSSDGDSVLGVFLGVNFSKTAEGTNPMVPSKIGFKFAVASGEKTITMPMSKHELLRKAEDERLSKLDEWDEMQKATTEVRHMVTGNLLTGYRSFVSAGKRPEVVMYSSNEGGTRPGIQVPKSMERELESLFRFTSTGSKTALEYLAHIKKVNANNAHVSMTTGAPVTVMWSGSMNKWRVNVEGSPQNNQAVMDRRLIEATDAGRFDQRNGDWSAVVSEENLPRMMQALESAFSAKFNVPRDFKNKAGEGNVDLSIHQAPGIETRKINQSNLARIKAAIERILPQGVMLELVDKLEYDLDQVATGAKAHGLDLEKLRKKGKLKVVAKGSHRTVKLTTGELTSLIKLSMSKATEATGYHEILHAAEALGVINAEDLKILERAFPEKNGKSSKEMRADAFGDFVTGNMKQGTPSAARLIFQKIKVFLEKLANVFRGLGYRTAEDVFSDLYSGKLKAENVRKSTLVQGYSEDFSLVTDSLAAIEKVIKDAQGPSKIASFASKAIDRAKDIAGRMGPLGNLPDQGKYLAERYLTLGKIDAGEDLARQMHDALQGVSDEDAKAIYDFWTSPTMTVRQAGIRDVNAERTALEVKQKIVDIGRELVERDLLDHKTFMENLGSYVPRVYLKHILGDQGFKVMGTGRKASVMAYLKQRKDIPEEVRRILLGEIKDPAYLAAKAISVPLRDMAILDWLGDISKHNEWVLQASLVDWQFPANGKIKKVTPYWLLSEAKRLRDQIHHMPEEDRAEAKALADRMQSEGEAAIGETEGTVPDDFKQIPDSARYGALRGMYVRKEIHQDLIGTTAIFAGDASIAEKILGQGGALTKYTQYWKWAKVAANPPAQARNFVSNLVLLHISGVPFHKVPTRIVEAIKQIKNNGEAWQVAKQYGIRKASFSNEEMARIERELIDLEAKRAGKGIGWPQMKNLAMKLVNKTGDWYQFMEAVGKTAKIIDEMERGASAEEAAMAAHSSLFDYSLVNPSVRYLRNAPIGVPFLTFLYKSVPMMVGNFAKHPTRMIPYLALTYGLTQLVSSMTGMDDDDLAALKKALPVWLQERNHTYFLPYKDDRGRWQAVDLGYFFPWTAIGEMAQNAGHGEFGKLLSTSGVLGGPVPSMISAIQTNTDPFTKKQIIDKTSTPAQQAGQLMGYLYQLNMPTWLTNQGVAGKVKQAMGAEVDKFGDPKATWAQAGLRMAGVNLYAVEPTRSRARNISTMEGELTSLKREQSMELKNPKLSPDDRAEIIKEYGKLMDKKKSEIAKYKEESQLGPAALR